MELQAQYQAYKSEIDESIQNVLNTSQYIMGPEVKKLEEGLATYTGSKHVIACSSGTDALLIALMAIDIQPGDEVITTPFTFISTTEVVSLLGAVPVFVDVDPDTLNIDANKIEEKITKKTKAIIPVSLYGQVADMDEINAIALKNNLIVIEDGAQSFGATYKGKKSCNLSDCGCTSFFPSKPLGCYGDGGALFTNNDTLAEKSRLILAHGSKVRYQHELIGVNGRLDAIQAAILSFKLTLLNEHNNKRQNFAKEYDSRLLDLDWVKTPVLREGSNHIYHQYSIILDSRIIRKKFQAYLASKNIPTMIYYPIPLHKQKAYRIYHTKPLPISEKISQQIISLPIHPAMNIQQIKFICDVIKKFK